MPVLKPGTQEYRDYYNAIPLPGDTPPQQQKPKSSESHEDDSGRIRAPMSDRDEFYSKQPNVPPADVDKQYDKSEHEPKTTKGKEADKRLRADIARVQKAQQQQALSQAKSAGLEKKLPDIVAGGGVGVWNVYDATKGNTTRLFAVDRSQAIRVAQQYGLTPSRLEVVDYVKLSEADREALLSRIAQGAPSSSKQMEFERLMKLGAVPKDTKYKRETFKARETAERALTKRKVITALDRYRIGTTDEYDVASAIRGGVSDEEFRTCGFDMDVIGATRQWVKKHDAALSKLEPYQVGPGQYDMIAASKWLPRDVLHDAGFDAKDLASVEQYLDENDSYVNTLTKYRKDKGYDLVSAYEDGVSREFMLRVGFDEGTVNTIADNVDARKFLGDYRGDMVHRVKTGCAGGSCTVDTDDEDDVKLSGGGSCRKEKYDTLPKRLQQELDTLGMDRFEEKYLRTGETTKATLKEMGLTMIPIYGTYHTYKSGAPTWEVALSAALDLAWLVPPVRMVAGAARMGTKLTAKSFATAAKTITVAEARAVIDTVAHPKQALKILLDPAESLVRPSKVPLESVTITYHTAKVPSVDTTITGLKGVSNWTQEEAMQARDELMKLAIQQGKAPKTTLAGQEVKLERSILEKIGPVAVSGTEDVRPFMNGVTVGITMAKDAKGQMRSLFVAPNLAERFTVASSGGHTTEGGVRGALVIRDPEILRLMESSQKAYKGTAEVEMVLRPGAKLPPPQQTLFTRDLQGERITLLVFGKPYTEAELAGLKIFAPQETVKQIFSKRVTVSAVGSRADELAEVEERLSAAETRAARMRGSTTAEARQARAEVTTLAARRADLVADIERRATVIPQYAAIDTSGGRAFIATRRMVEAAADLQQAARAEVRKEARTGARATVRKPGRVSQVVEGRLPEALRKPQMPEARAIMKPSERVEVLRVPSSPETPYTPTKPETREPVRLPATPRASVPPIPPAPRIRKPDAIAAIGDRRMDDTGRVQWKQGGVWIMVEPPPTEGERQRNVYYSRRPFWGVRKVKGNPEQTFARQGKPPRHFLYEMGVTSASIHSYEKPHLRWRQTSAAKRRRGRLMR
jgi:hypothetical protein